MKILNVAKAALFGIFLNYYCYYVIVGEFIPMGTVAFLAVALLCVGVDVLRKRYIHVGTETRCWLAYAVLAAVTSLLVLGNMSFLGDIVKFVQRTLIILMVAYICQREGTIRFGLQLMAGTAVALAIAVLLVIGDIQLKLDITSGANLSENDTGAIMAFGCFALLYTWHKKERPSVTLSVLKVAGVIACLTVIFLSGSRKSIMAVMIMAALWLLLCFRDYFGHLNLKVILAVVAGCLVAYLVVAKRLLPYAAQTTLYRRLFGAGATITEDSDEMRMRLIGYALKHFIENPLCGLGFAQFENYHGVYSHCTYVEPLACSGIIGLLYLYPYLSILRKQLQLISSTPKGSTDRIRQKELLIYWCMFLFIGVGIPFLYKDAPCIILGTMLAAQKISFDQLEGSAPIHSSS